MHSPKDTAKSKAKALLLPPNSPEQLDLLRDHIELFLTEHPRLLLSEPGREVMDLSETSYSLSTEFGKLTWHLWNERSNLVRQITSIARERPGRLELKCQRFGKGPAGTLILADTRADAESLERRGRRVEFARHLKRWLAQLFPDARIDELTTETSMKDSLSGCYARGVLNDGGRLWAVMGVGEEESPAVVDGILTYGLLWLDHLRRQQTSRVVAGLKLFLPRGQSEFKNEGRSETTRQRMPWLNSAAALWELYETGPEVIRLDISDAGNFRTSLHRPQQSGELRAGKLLSEDVPLARRMEQLSDRIVCRMGSDGSRRWSIHGLVIARERANDSGSRIFFGLGRAETGLTEQSFERLRRLAQQVLDHRMAPVSKEPDSVAEPLDRQHPLFRICPELWMEDVLVNHAESIVPDLLGNQLARQVFSVSGYETGFADLLGVARGGRLAIIELKASEDIHLPLQGLDYWMRVHWHMQRGDFARHGFFPGGELSAEPPRLLLVSPGLQFHPTCQTVLHYFSQKIDVEMIGVNEAWRVRPQVVFRKHRDDFRRSE